MTSEIERCWCALPPNPGGTLEALERVAHLDGNPLGPVETVALDDRVLDTGDDSLRRRRLTFRLRLADGEPLLTVKGPSKIDPGGAVRRPEWEAPWSEAALVEALARIAALGGPQLAALPPTSGAEPLDRLAAVGLRTVHARRTERRRRAVSDPGGVPLAELALDTVRFDLGPWFVLHREVELELETGADPTAFDGAAAAVARVGGPRLQHWPFSKSALGAALERWGADGRSKGMLDQAGRPTRAAYGELAAELDRAL